MDMNMADVNRAISRLQKLREQRDLLEQEIVGLIQMLRSPDMDGRCAASWLDIGCGLGVSRQAAQQRYDRHV